MNRLLQEAVDRSDLELLFTLWTYSLTEVNGAQVRTYIEEYLPYLSEQLGLSGQASFRDLVQEYDLEQFKKQVRNMLPESILHELRKTNNRNILHYAADNANEIAAQIEEWQFHDSLLHLISQMAVEKDDPVLLQKILDYYIAEFEYVHHFGVVLSFSVDYDKCWPIDLIFEQENLDNDRRIEMLNDVLPYAAKEGNRNNFQCLLNWSSNVKKKLDFPVLKKTLSASEMFETALASSALKRNYLRRWRNLRKLLTAILTYEITHSEVLLDLLFDYLDRTDNLHYNRATEYVNDLQ